MVFAAAAGALKGIGTFLANNPQITGSLIEAGTTLASGLLGKSNDPKKVSTFSRRQKEIDQSLFDLLMGVTRDSKGREIGRDPWIERLLEKRQPQQKVAPLTANQQQAQQLAGALVPRVANVARPDSQLLAGLQQGVLPQQQQRRSSNVHFAAAGGVFGKGDSFVVGEAGPEKIDVLDDGTVVVTPNPKTFSSRKKLTEALQKSVRAQQEFQLPGLVAGGTISPKRKFGDTYRDVDLPGAGVGADYFEASPGRRQLRSAFEKQLQEEFDAFSARDAKDQRQDPNARFFRDFYGLNNFAKNKKFTPGDIFSVPYANARNKPFGGRLGKLRQDYFSRLGDFIKGNTDVVHDNEALNELLGQNNIGLDRFDDFQTFLTGSKFNDPNNDLVVRGGQVSFTDPFSVDLGNLQAALNEFNLQADNQNSQQTADQQTTDRFNELLQQVGADNYSAFNQFLDDDFQGGVLKGSGIAFDPTVGDFRFQGPASFLPGIEAAVSAFGPRQEAINNALATLNSAATTTTDPNQTPSTGPITFSTGDLVQDDNGNFVPDPNQFEFLNGQYVRRNAEPSTTVGTDQQLNQILDALTTFTQPFDADTANQRFDTAVAEPALQRFETDTVGAIDAATPAPDFFGSGRNKRIDAAREELNRGLTAQRSQFIQSTEQAYRNRSLSALNAQQQLFRLPDEQRNRQADREYVNALTANVFNNMAWTNALNDSRINNEQLNSLALLWQLFQPQQQLDQNLLNAAMTNAFNADGGFDLMNILPLVMGFQEQQQTAFIS